MLATEEQVSGAIVGNFQAYDPDGDSLTYELATGEGDGNNHVHFGIKWYTSYCYAI